MPDRELQIRPEAVVGLVEKPGTEDAINGRVQSGSHPCSGLRSSLAVKLETELVLLLERDKSGHSVMKIVLSRHHVRESLSPTTDPDGEHDLSNFGKVDVESRRACEILLLPPAPDHPGEDVLVVDVELGHHFRGVLALLSRHRGGGSRDEAEHETHHDLFHRCPLCR